MVRARAVTLVALLALLPRAARAAPFALSTTVGSAMVLQRDQPTSSLWGTSSPGAVVTATLSIAPGAPARAVTGADGVWRAALPAFPATATPFNVTFSSDGAADVVIADVLFGDVVFCSGQSNLQLSLQMSLNASAEINATDAFGPMVRVFYVAGSGQAAPQRDVGAAVRWSRAGRASMGQDSWGGFSGQCWFTGRSLFFALGGAVPVGLIESSVGGTAIRNWAPTSALAQCPQPYNSPNPYGTGPYEHSALFNGMVNGFGTGPTALRMVLWDQAESDSYPQTPIGYYSCQTIAQINSWRALLRPPAAAAQLGPLPWVFLHLQPYHGSGPCCLEDLRQQQLAALMLPAVGVATAIDLGDIDSPYGDVHFRNKQVAGARAAAAALAVAYAPGAGSPEYALDYPAPAFLSQQAFFVNATSTATIIVSFDHAGAAAQLLANASVSCPDGTPPSNCTALEVLGSDGNTYPAASQALSTIDGTLTLTAVLPSGVYGVGSAYANSMWPRILLYSAQGLPVLPWRQALTIGAPPPAPPGPQRLVRLRYQASGLCLSTNASSQFPCPGGWSNSCPLFLGDCAAAQSTWIEDADSGFLANSVTANRGTINIDCDNCSAGRVAKIMVDDGGSRDGSIFPHFVAGGGGVLAISACDGSCLSGGQGTATPTCEAGEATAEHQVQVAACADATAQGWSREILP